MLKRKGRSITYLAYVPGFLRSNGPHNFSGRLNNDVDYL